MNLQTLVKVFGTLAEIAVVGIAETENTVLQVSEVIGFQGFVSQSSQHFGSIVRRLAFSGRRANEHEQLLVHQPKLPVDSVGTAQVRRETVGRGFIGDVLGDRFGLTRLGSVDQEISEFGR